MSDQFLQQTETRWLVVANGESSLSTSKPEAGGVEWVDVDLTAVDDREAQLAGLLRDVATRWETPFDDELLATAAKDLADSDDWPEMKSIGPARKLSLTCLVQLDPNQSPKGHSSDTDPEPPVLYASRVEIVLTKDWLVSAWHEIERITQSGEPTKSIPYEVDSLRAAMAEMVADTVETDELTTGGDLGIALIRGSIATFSEHRKDLHKRLDDWEHNYYERHFSATDEKASETTRSESADQARMSTKTLAEIHAAGVDLSRELDHLTAPRDRAALHWVGKGTTSPEGVQAAEVYDEKIDRYRTSLRDIRDRVRAGLDLSHSVESTARDEASQKRDSFIAKVAAVFLAPTLIAGFYGINTKYPGADTTDGTIEAIVLMILSAIGAWGGIVWFENRDRKKGND